MVGVVNMYPHKVGSTQRVRHIQGFPHAHLEEWVTTLESIERVTMHSCMHTPAFLASQYIFLNVLYLFIYLETSKTVG